MSPEGYELLRTDLKGAKRWLFNNWNWCIIIFDPDDLVTFSKNS